LAKLVVAAEARSVIGKLRPAEDEADTAIIDRIPAVMSEIAESHPSA
jgi:hypothetical protein